MRGPGIASLLAPAPKMCKYSGWLTMDIQVESRGNRRIVRITGKITFEHCPHLQNRLDQVLEEGVVEVVIDFAGVPFIDSSGIGEILRLYKFVRDRQGEVVLINPNQKLHNLFTMYRFEKFMKIRDSVEVGQE
jgi:anti-anti-sigma factor